MKLAYFDCFAGAGGDMIAAALIDAGVDPDQLRSQLDSLGLTGYTLTIDSTERQGLRATRFDVRLDPACKQPHRSFAGIKKLILDTALPADVKRRVVDVFGRLAAAEAKVHGTTVESVHFHEVGAVDAILDIVSAVLSLHCLEIDRVVCSPLPTGSGSVVCDHGELPVPAPATVELLQGVPVYGSDQRGEVLTPTAAAVLTAVADDFGPLPAMRLQSVGCGAGQRDTPPRPNVLRVMIGESASEGPEDEITVLETSIDDTSPELIGRCMERLFASGALDAYASPIQMKKSRPGVLLTVLCRDADREAMERIIFAETTTFGIRRHRAARVMLTRRSEVVDTTYGRVRIKIGERDGLVTAAPEFEDCRTLAEQHGIAVREVLTAATVAWNAGRHVSR